MGNAITLLLLGSALCTFVYYSWSVDRGTGFTEDPEFSIDAEFHGIIAPFGDRSWVKQVEGRRL